MNYNFEKNIPKRQEGATLLCSVLLMLAVMTVIITFTTYHTLAARQSTVRQDEALTVQYRAESGMARIQAQLSAVSDVLTRDLRMPWNEEDVFNHIAALCSDPPKLPCGSSKPLAKSVLGSTSMLRSRRLSFFTDYIPKTAYAQHGWTLQTPTHMLDFWSHLLSDMGLDLSGQIDGQSFTAALRLNFLGAEATSAGYNLYFRVPPLTASSSDYNIHSTGGPVYTLRIEGKSFAEYNLGLHPQGSQNIFPEHSNKQSQAAQAGGIYLPKNVSRLELVAQKVMLDYHHQEAQIIRYQEEDSHIIELAYGQDGRMFIWNGHSYVPARLHTDHLSGASNGTWEASWSSDIFNGVVYAKQGINCLGSARSQHRSSPAVASFAQLTLAAGGNIHITGDLRYSLPCAEQLTSCSLSNKNILGIYARGNITVHRPVAREQSRASRAPLDMTLHAILMAGAGQIITDDQEVQTAYQRGTLHIRGNLIEKSPSHETSRDSLVLVHDQRTLQGLAPPFFPAFGPWKISLAPDDPMKLGSIIVRTTDL